jgi:hypothetical protein
MPLLRFVQSSERSRKPRSFRRAFFGSSPGEVAGIRCIGLNKVRMPGNLVAIDFDSRERKWEILGEWPS